MNSYIVSYDLMAPHKDYSGLISAIKSYGTYAKVLESCWLIWILMTKFLLQNLLVKLLGEMSFVQMIG